MRKRLPASPTSLKAERHGQSPGHASMNFFLIVTHSRIYDPPSPIQSAVDQLDAWFESPTLALLSETPDYWVILRPIISYSQISGPMIHDARIAVLCIQNGVTELLTADRDFGRFHELKTRNPLIG